MAQDDNTDSLAELAAQLLERAARDPEQVRLLQHFARTILKTFPDEPPPADTPPTVPLAAPADIDAFIANFSHKAQADAEGVAAKPVRADVPLSDLPVRLQLKARACAWLAEHGYTQKPLALGERKTLLDEANRMSCYLWMFDLEYVNPSASTQFADLDRSYRATARALELLSRYPRRAELLRLTALCQSRLRSQVARARPEVGGAPFIDDDQSRIFSHLRESAAQQQVFLAGLSLKDSVDDVHFETLQGQLERLEAEVATAEQRRQGQRATLKQIAYHARQLHNRSRRPEHDWAKIAGAVAQLTERGLPESDGELRALLEPLAPLFPEASPHPQLRRILGDAARVAREKAERLEAQAKRRAETQPEEVQQVARLIAGRRIVVIGGTPNERASELYAEAFGAEVNWLKSKPHDPPRLFEPHIAKGEVVLVLLLIRWSSHVFGEVSAFCKAHGKYLVRVKAGYNTRKIAQVILEQAGERLGKGA